MKTLVAVYMFLSFVVWIIAPIRQIKQKYFMFFLFLILGDIVTLSCRYIFYSNTNVFFIVADLLCLISIQERKSSNLFKILILAISAATFIVEFYKYGYKWEFVLISFSNFLLFIKFIQQFIIKYCSERSISIFLGILAFYELLSITKFFGFIAGSANAELFFDIATSLEVIIGIFFCIFKQNNPRISFELK
jgi:hypothetical protein